MVKPAVPAAEVAAAAAVAAAPLRWASDAQPGIGRRPCGHGFVYVDAAGRVLRDATTLQRIRTLAVPPAWSEVWICTDATGHLQATGRDARGRKQYRYHAAWQAQRGQTKFDQLRRFAQALPRIRRRVQRVLRQQERRRAAPTRELVLATLVRLLDATCMRIGNDAYRRDNGSFGLSTLRTRHAQLSGDELRLGFVGKGGVRHDVRLSDRRIARVVRRCRELLGQPLFQYADADGQVRGVDSSDVNAWLAAAARLRVTAKDFRTWHGSVHALDLLLAACAEHALPCRASQLLEQVAQRLGNTPAICRKAYVHPRVLDLSDALGDTAARRRLRAQRWAASPPAQRGLSLAERRLLALLRSARDRPGAKARAGVGGANAG